MPKLCQLSALANGFCLSQFIPLSDFPALDHRHAKRSPHKPDKHLLLTVSLSAYIIDCYLLERKTLLQGYLTCRVRVS